MRLKSITITGLVLVWTASGQTKLSLSSQSKDVDFTGAASTRPFRSGSTLPAACGTGESFYLTTATPGQNLYACTGANQWTPLAGSSLPSVAGQSGTVLSNDGSGVNWVPLGGDVSGNPGAQSVQGLRGIPISGNPPSGGQALVYNSSLNLWQPGSGGTVPDWPVTRTSDTQLTIGVGPGVRIGNTFCQAPVNNAVVTIGGGTGTLFLFIRGGCELVAAHNLLVSSCQNCTATTGTGYEANSFPLGQWTVTNGILSASGMSAVTPYSLQPLLAGNNILLTRAGGSIQINGPSLVNYHPVRMIGYTFDFGGTPLTSGGTKFLTVPFACTLTGWDIAADAGTATVQVWKASAGTAVPSPSDSISRNGVSLATGTAIRSSDMSDFLTTSVLSGDIFGFTLSAVSGASYVNFVLECVQ